jgi:hypothetical protein
MAARANRQQRQRLARRVILRSEASALADYLYLLGHDDRSGRPLCDSLGHSGLRATVRDLGPDFAISSWTGHHCAVQSKVARLALAELRLAG